METALLLRRLKARIKTSTKTQFILTSATLGEEGKSEKEIIHFAESLCGETFDETSIIYGKRETLVFDGEINNYPIELFEDLATATTDEYAGIFNRFGIFYDSTIPFAHNLYNLCRNSIYYKRIREE
jgi:ATP-dependent helicase YprA (DUF1998 family)